jgi:RNA polymerase sigma-70 factor (ECF subfamily)
MALSEQQAEADTARVVDAASFAAKVEPHRKELQLHCYRMLGSFEDSEDLVQETFLRAWRARASFEGRSSFRAWLYKIATNACLDALQRRPRAPAQAGGERPVAEVPWLQPYPDDLLEGVASREDEPDAQVVARETIELAFIAAIQLLPPRQRVALIARDVLGWSAAESAELLDVSVAALNSALQRARATMRERLPRGRLDWAPDTDPTEEERALVERYVEASEQGDPAAMVQLMREDAFFAMPPQPLSVVGSKAIVDSWVEGGFGDEMWGVLKCVHVKANKQPAVAFYVRRPGESDYLPLALDVLRIEDGALAEVIAFPLEPLLEALDLPPTL